MNTDHYQKCCRNSEKEDIALSWNFANNFHTPVRMLVRQKKCDFSKVVVLGMGKPLKQRHRDGVSTAHIQRAGRKPT